MKIKSVSKLLPFIILLVVVGIFVFGQQAVLAKTCCCKVESGNVSDCAYYEVPMGGTCQLTAGLGPPPPSWEEKVGKCSPVGCCRCQLQSGYSRCEEGQTDNECVDLGDSLGVFCGWAANEPCSMYATFCSNSVPSSTTPTTSKETPTCLTGGKYTTGGFYASQGWYGFLPPCIACGNCKLVDIVATAVAQFNICVAIFGGLALLFLIYGGVRLLISAGNPESVQAGKRVIVHTIIGIIIILTAWLLVNLIIATLTGNEEGTIFEQPWYRPINLTPTPADWPPSTGTPPSAAAPTVPPPAGGSWIFDPGIDSQWSDLSPQLTQLLSCMRAKLPVGVGRISSISDSKLYTNPPTCSWEPVCLPNCPPPANCCSHSHPCDGDSSLSCHYGGSGCYQLRESYAVDFGDEENAEELMDAARICDSSVFFKFEGDHLHMSIGHKYNCNCN